MLQIAELQEKTAHQMPIASARRHRGPAKPTLHSIHGGDLVWFPYTANQWMRGRVLSFSRRGLSVEVMGGRVTRTMHVKWADAHWHQPREVR